MKSNEHSTSYFLDFKIHLAARCFAFRSPFPTAGGLFLHTRVCHLASDMRLRCTNFLNHIEYFNWNISWTQKLKIEIFFTHKPLTISCWNAYTLYAKKTSHCCWATPTQKSGSAIAGYTPTKAWRNNKKQLVLKKHLAQKFLLGFLSKTLERSED